MKRLSLILLFFALVCLPLAAQQMSVDGFTRLRGIRIQKDKSAALLDLYTQENGFTILGEENEPLDLEECDGFIRIRMPRKTSHLSIRHQEYGQLSWKTPSPLKKRRHYQANLYAVDPTKEFKATHQWVLLHVKPENAIVHLDSLSKSVRNGFTDFFLPLGNHHYRVEAPFFEAEEGSFTLTDSLRKDISVNLQPQYSYLSVKTDLRGGTLLIDGTPIRTEEATSYRLGEGYHHVTYLKADKCLYDSLLFVNKASKQIIELYVNGLPASSSTSGYSPDDTLSVMVPVSLSCKDPEAEIMVDREIVGNGLWEGMLPLGFHLFNARKNGQEGDCIRVLLKDAFPQEITLMAPGTGMGLINVYSNLKDARISIDGKDRGSAPQLIWLDASCTHEVTVYGPGYKQKKCKVRPKAGAQTDIYFRLKKR